jgi:hypothetical protein
VRTHPERIIEEIVQTIQGGKEIKQKRMANRKEKEGTRDPELKFSFSSHFGCNCKELTGSHFLGKPQSYLGFSCKG